MPPTRVRGPFGVGEPRPRNGLATAPSPHGSRSSPLGGFAAHVAGRGASRGSVETVPELGEWTQSWRRSTGRTAEVRARLRSIHSRSSTHQVPGCRQSRKASRCAVDRRSGTGPRP
jgi:hypothetical protein